MKRILFTVYLLFMISFFSFAEDSFYGKVEITMNIKNYIASPIVTICCKNMTSKNIEIPKCYLIDNYMFDSYFEFISSISDISESIPKYIGKKSLITVNDKKEVVTLKPGKSVFVNYSLSDFYSLPDDMYTVQIISYIGPLGYGDQQFVYFSENMNQYDFDIDLNIKNENGNLIAELTHKYLSKDDKYYSKGYFVSTENLSGTVFYITINGKEIDYRGIIGDSFGFKGFIGDKVLLKKGDIIKTNTVLNQFFDIPNIEEIKSYKIYYKGYLGNSNIEEITFE